MENKIKRCKAINVGPGPRKGKRCKMPAILDGYCIRHYSIKNGK